MAERSRAQRKLKTIPTPRPEGDGRRYHLDRRAHLIIAQGNGDPHDLLTTKEVADWFGVSVAWLEIGRSVGYGPRYVKLGPGIIRYRREVVLAWLDERQHRHTGEYRP